jgi:hypothetical protein
MGSDIIYANDSISLICTASAIPPVTKYIFYHNGSSIGESASGVFNLSHVSASGNGTYSCTAENIIGRGPAGSLTLKFLGKFFNRSFPQDCVRIQNLTGYKGYDAIHFNTNNLHFSWGKKSINSFIFASRSPCSAFVACQLCQNWMNAQGWVKKHINITWLQFICWKYND